MNNKEIWAQVSRYFEARRADDVVTMAEAANNIQLSLTLAELEGYQPGMDRPN